MKLKQADVGFDIAAPQASALIESLRAFGYDLPTAIADIVDNSIYARAANIWIDFYWNGAESIVTISDDGCGMSEQELVAAMRPGSRSPLELRDSSDLGRFGLGLKTASFSQCRRLTVISKAFGGKEHSRCWDLDHVVRVNDWQLLRQSDASLEQHFKKLAKLKHGTTVVWQHLDRLVKGGNVNDEAAQKQFHQRVDDVKQHLAIVFHNLLSESNGVKIFLNGHTIKPWDPFLADEPATQILPATSVPYGKERIQVRPYVLPHHSKISKVRFENASGPRGWNAHQGFYIYRNRRLLVSGDWLGLGWTKEEHYKLARISVEIPNTMDHEWSIDVTKSQARPPAGLRNVLRRIAERTRSVAKKVYSSRGAKLISTENTKREFIWEPKARHNKIFYKLNRTHPILKKVQASCADRAAFRALLRMVEETVPYSHITINNSECPGSLPGPFEYTSESEIREMMEQAYASLKASGYASSAAINRLKTIWPFELYPAVLKTVEETYSND